MEDEKDDEGFFCQTWIKMYSMKETFGAETTQKIMRQRAVDQ